MKKLIGILALSLILTVYGNPAIFGAVKTGTACSKVGLVATTGDKSYSCIKFGKKLIWNKGVYNPKQTLPNIPTNQKSNPSLPSNLKVVDDGVKISFSWNAPTQVTSSVEFYRIHGDCFQGAKPCGSYEHDIWTKDQNGDAETKFEIDRKDLVKTPQVSTWKFKVSAENQTLNIQSTFVNFELLSISSISSNNSPQNKTESALKIYPAGSGNPSPPVYPENDGSRAIQKIIDNLDLSKSTNATVVNVMLESGKNGPYADIGITGVNFALKFYSALGMNIPHPVVNLILARTHQWGLEQIRNVIPDCNIQDGPVFDGGVTLCPSPTNGTIFTNLVQGTAHDPNINPDIDLSTVIETSDWLADFAHETMHVYQFSQNSNMDNLPNWMREGAAQFFGYLTAAKYSNGAISYNSEVEKYLDWRHDVQGACSTPTAMMQSPCEYTQGLFVVEYLVQKYGVKGYQDLLFNSGAGDLNSRLQAAFGITQNEFYSDVDKYLKERNWEK